jgi:hypothetical protein
MRAVLSQVYQVTNHAIHVRVGAGGKRLKHRKLLDNALFDVRLCHDNRHIARPTETKSGKAHKMDPITMETGSKPLF